MTAAKGPNGGPPPLILASGSPRRHELLSQVGIDHEIIAPNLSEDRFHDNNSVRRARTIAAAKAEAVRITLPGAQNRWVLAADTVVAVAGRIMGKPSNRAGAAAMIRRLSGRTHTVVTGVAIWPPHAEKPTVGEAKTKVVFAEITDEELQNYLMLNEWEDVAGAYRIQGTAALFIQRISGSYSNVVGLPIQLVYSILIDHGYWRLGGYSGRK